ncbi:MAG TPA: hypothetical protein VI756_08235 [Blastocatellia bacterium]
MGAKGKTSSGLLIPGLLILGAGLALLAAHSVAGLAMSILRFWPLFLILAGFVRIIGFVVGRRPRSPVGGALLVAIGAMLLLGILQSGLTPLQVYARYWPVLLVVMAAVHLARFYSHRPWDSRPPRLLGPLGIITIVLLVSTGIAAHVVSARNPNLLSAASLPALLHGLPPGSSPRSFTFAEPAYESAYTVPISVIKISNKFGEVRVVGGNSSVKATLTTTVRAWDEADAKTVADGLKLTVNKTSDSGRESFSIAPDCRNNEFPVTGNLVVQVPDGSPLELEGADGPVSASRTSGPLSVNAHGSSVILESIKGDVNAILQSADFRAAAIEGDLKITGGKQVSVSGVSGLVDISANEGSLDLRAIQGKLDVVAPESEIRAQNLTSDAEIKSSNGSIDLSKAAGVTIDAPDSEVHAESITGDLKISSSNKSISVHSLAGDLTVEASRSPLTVGDVHGIVAITDSNGAVTVKNFSRAVMIHGDHSAVTLVSDETPEGDIDVEDLAAPVKLVLPSTADFQFSGESPSGRVRSKGFSFVPLNGQPVAQGADRLEFSQGLGGHKVVLRTSHNDILIEGKSRL